MDQLWGVLAAVLSSGLGGTSVAATRYLVEAIDPFATGALRFGIGFILLLPLALTQKSGFPERKDWPAVVGLGVLFFAIFPILFNAALIFTTAARGALALSTLPLLTMVVAAVFRSEPLTLRKTIGVLIAMSGVALALLSGLASAPAGAWRGDLLMIVAALCMAVYSVASKAVMRRCAPIPFTAVAMGVGAVILITISWLQGSFTPIPQFGLGNWTAAVYLGAVGGALTFYLWAFALERTTPTRVAISVTVNPISAALVGALLLHERIGWDLAGGIVTVFIGIWVATTERRTRPLLTH